MVSLIIPNYNKSSFLNESLLSIVNQTYQNWEAIIVDDGSTDDSLKIINQFVEKDIRFKCFPQNKTKNGGSVCRNIGLANSRGDLVMFFDSDDVLAPFCLEKRLKFLMDNPNLDFAVFPMHTFNQSLGDHQFIWKPEKENAINRFLSHNLPWQTMQPIYKADFLKKYKLKFDEHFPRMQDVEFHSSVLLKQPNFEIDENKPDCYFRINPNRKVFNPLQLYTQWTDAAMLFYQKFKAQNQSIKHLGLTILMAMSEIITAKNQGELKKPEAKMLLLKMISNLPSKQKNTLGLYGWFGVNIPFHIKGLRWFFGKLISFVS